MASLDSSIKSLLQGVSQQVPSERLDGQVSAQLNMLSDPVQGMRRRPGLRLLQGSVLTGLGGTETIFCTSADVGDDTVHIIVNVLTGNLRIYNSNWALITESTLTYLVADSASQLYTASLRGQLYICNKAILPTKVTDKTGFQDPDRTGFVYIKSTSYSKVFNVTITVDGTEYTGSYTAPDGTASGDAAKTTPEYVLGKVIESLALTIPGTLGIQQSGAYAYIVITSGALVSVSSDSGDTYVVTSGASRVTVIGNLPARLPTTANGVLVAVGSDTKTAVWYTYDAASTSWKESGDYASASALENMPIRISLDGAYTIETPVYEGRNAGNDDTNEDPAFITDGVTGFGAFQGRLVLLSGGTVCMSAAGKPLRWYRSTVTETLIVDSISIYSGAATTTEFTHAVQFNKDLLLFSKTCQAVIPSGNAVIAPSTAQIVITSGYATTTAVAPVVAGRSLLYFAPRSEDYASTLEMVPSNTTDSQYTSNDVTAHLPTYFGGTVRAAAAGTTSNYVVLSCTDDPTLLYVYQYLWGDNTKAQTAWHQWQLPYAVSQVWFVRDTIYVGMIVNGTLVVACIEPSAASTYQDYRRPFADLYDGDGVLAVNRTIAVPLYLRQAVTNGGSLMAMYPDGTMAGELAGIESLDTSAWTLTLVRNSPDQRYMLGVAFTSSLEPTPPLMRDSNGKVIGTGQTILTRYELGVYNTGAFHATVTTPRGVVTDQDFSGLLFASPELAPNYPTVASTARVIVPVRATSLDTRTVFTATGEHDMNITSAEYVLQYHQRRRRV